METKKLLLSSFVVAGLILSTGCAGKFHKGDFENKVFDRFDKDENNALSKKEHLNLALHLFKKIDKNEDGEITKKEIKECIFFKLQKNYLKKYDLNNNNVVTKSEVIEQTKQDFIKLDKNNDGVLSKVEYEKENNNQ